MRVSTSMIYDQGLRQIQSQTAGLLKTQQQIASGRRILTPADDPVAAARALEIRQSQSTNEQFLANQAAASDRLRTAENRLTGIGDIMQYMRERTVQAGNAALGPEELRYLATDLKAQFDALLGLANSRDAQGDYVFAGYQTNTQPYGNVFGDINYQGDSNSLRVQVSASRFMPVSFTGDDVFGRARPLEPGVAIQSVLQPSARAAFNVSLSPDSVQPDSGIQYDIRYLGTDQFSVTRREADGTTSQLDPVSYVPGTGALSFDGGVVLNVAGTLREGDRVQVLVGASGITVANASGQTTAGFSLALTPAAGGPAPDTRYVVRYDGTTDSFVAARFDAGVEADPAPAAVFDPAAGTLDIDGVVFNLAGTPRDGDVVQVFVGDRTLDATLADDSLVTGVTLTPTSAVLPLGTTYSLTYDEGLASFTVSRFDNGVEVLPAPAVTSFDPLSGVLVLDDGAEFEIAGVLADGEVLQVGVNTELFTASSGAFRPASEPLSLNLAEDSAALDPGVRYIVRYDADQGGFVVQRRAPVDPAATPDPGWQTLPANFDPDTGTLSFLNSEGEEVRFDVSGVPNNGDAVEVLVAGNDIFANMALFIDALNRPGPGSMADGPVGFALRGLDVALESILRVRAQVGSQLVEIDNLSKVGGDLGLQYASEISRLEDLDYAEAISRLTQQQVFLEAAQQTYLRVTGLSLFNYLS